MDGMVLGLFLRAAFLGGFASGLAGFATTVHVDHHVERRLVAGEREPILLFAGHVPAPRHELAALTHRQARARLDDRR